MMIIITCMVFLIVLYPKEIIEATQNGLNVWFNSVLPSLLPFFIGSELLVGLGIVKFLGILIEPIIKPVFKVPGEASFVFAMSITSGYPMGAKLTSYLRKNKSISKVEAQRMIAFCSTSGPLFIIGAVAIGMFSSPKIGPYIALSHYLGALTIGILFRFYKSNETYSSKKNGKKNILRNAFNEMIYARQKDGRSFGKLLSDSVNESISTLILIGGLIVVFSVINCELSLIGLTDYIYKITKNIFNTNITKNLIETIFAGFIEITMGCKLASQLVNFTPIVKIVLATMIISWSGLSIHAQVASLINETDIDIKIYIFSKFLHSIFSGMYIYIIAKIFKLTLAYTYKETFLQEFQGIKNYCWFNTFFFSTKLFLTILCTLACIGIFFSLINKNNN
ncbi:sporulation integral membrane protein YlbJ [Caminicella sporogenes]|nr:sporulation integral membrane protein YlbJ [Caminicella sporogenes]